MAVLAARSADETDVSGAPSFRRAWGRSKMRATTIVAESVFQRAGGSPPWEMLDAVIDALVPGWFHGALEEEVVQ